MLPSKIWYLWAPDGEGEWWFQRGYDRYDRHVLIFRTVRVINQLYYFGALACCAVAVTLLWLLGLLGFLGC